MEEKEKECVVFHRYTVEIQYVDNRISEEDAGTNGPKQYSNAHKTSWGPQFLS